MKERPIIFKGEMTKAILDGRKSQTRRIIKPQPTDVIVNVPYIDSICGTNKIIDCPYGAQGDRLWVRETFALHPHFADMAYKADGPEFTGKEFVDSDGWRWEPKWKPSIHMPRKFSRITLEIVGIRVERLQDISEEDAESEGIDFLRHAPDADETLTAKQLFKILWSVINGDESWNANPLVWVIEFKQSA